MPATLFWECLLRIFLAALCGLVIGFERKARLKEAGVRTHLIVALGAALITIVSKYGFFDLALFAEGIKADPTRIAAQIVSGVGFLGAGMIFMRHRTLTGLTTAAGIWTTAGIGMAVGCGLYAVSLFSTALVVLTQLMLHRDYRWTRAPGCTAVCLRTQPGPTVCRGRTPSHTCNPGRLPGNHAKPPLPLTASPPPTPPLSKIRAAMRHTKPLHFSLFSIH